MEKTKEEKKLIVKMLGDFSVSWGDENITIGRKASDRPAQLFQLLMLSPGHSISKEKLIGDLYRYDEVNNKNNSINNLIYRLRRCFQEAGVTEEACIFVENGMCFWNSKIPVEVDVLEFFSLMEKSRKVSGEECQKYLYQAWLLCRGELLSCNSMEEWVILENVHYKQLYRECTSKIASYLEEKNRYEDLFNLYSKAVGIEPYEEWQLGQLDALMAMGEYEKAYQLYERLSRSYTDFSGLPLSGEMLKRFRTISQNLKGGYETLHDIQLQIIRSDLASEFEGGGRKNAPFQLL